MTAATGTEELICAVYVDMGTTNTRAWLMRENQILAQASRNTGIRDSARTRSSLPIRRALAEVIHEVRTQAGSSHKPCAAACVAAAGMISSPLGLMEVAHIPAPAGTAELAASSRWVECPDVTDLPILLVPGVRSGAASATIDQMDSADVMRGEETLCAGLNALGLIQPPVVVLNLGSHWKVIRIDQQGRVECSSTSLSGELIHAAQTQTILASSVPQERPTAIAPEWLERGMREQRRSGLARALFCIRLLDLAGEGTPEERLAFLVGAFIASDLDALSARGMLAKNIQVVIVGGAAIAHAWRSALLQAGVDAALITAADAEKAFLTGLRCILEQSRAALSQDAAC